MFRSADCPCRDCGAWFHSLVEALDRWCAVPYSMPTLFAEAVLEGCADNAKRHSLAEAHAYRDLVDREALRVALAA